VLRIERCGLAFEPGQYICLGRAGSLALREYTVYSSPEEDHLEALIKEIPSGLVSRALRRLSPGDPVELTGPFGRFRLVESDRAGTPLFVATGTGVSPFHCFVRSYPGLDYRLLHGVRCATELYERQVFDPGRTVACVSRDPGGDYPGRVTAYLGDHPVSPETACYLCGNSDMIYETMALLRAQGVPRDRIFAEIYF
jgi:ferredoxin--NADP+ reductase/benzoate/toluate 1,2-dioxygenase reductase subunit